MGSGGKRVTGAAIRPAATSAATMSRMKFERSGVSTGDGVEAVIGAAPATGMGEETRLTRRTTLPWGVGWRARIRTWNPLIQSQVLYR